MTKTIEQILLQCESGFNRFREDKQLLESLSVVVQVKDDLWLGCDESTTLERLSAGEGDIYQAHETFPLRDYIILPAKEDNEIDIEGMAYQDNYLYFVGSHSLKRSKPKETGDTQQAIEDLAHVESDGNRYILARIPLVKDKDGRYQLFKSCPDPKHPRQRLKAAQLEGTKKKNELTEALKKDKHLAKFLGIPGKDNGFDIEGLAVAGKKVFLGLRGPVLRGWAVIIEIELGVSKSSNLKLKKIGPNGQLYKKHFLHLNGLGIRELCAYNSDLLILAGPTMDLDGPVQIFRWRGGAEVQEETLLRLTKKDILLDVPYGQGEDMGKDHAEGMTIISRQSHKPCVLIVYDAPAKVRRKVNGVLMEDAILADVFPLDISHGNTRKNTERKQ